MADIIDQLLALDDAALGSKFGFTQKLEAAKEDLKEAATLKGESRAMVVERINSMLTPNIYPDDIGYAVKRAKAKEASKGKTTPTSLAADCGCEVDPY